MLYRVGTLRSYLSFLAPAEHRQPTTGATPRETKATTNAHDGVQQYVFVYPSPALVCHQTVVGSSISPTIW